MIEISEKEVGDRLAFDNPWWASGAVRTAFRELPHRAYYDAFYRLVGDLDVRRAIILMGPRRVGKTVMVHQAIQGLLDDGAAGDRILFASMETPLYSGLPLERLVRMFLDIHGHGEEQLYVVFDEVQYLKDWEVHLKSLVDSYPFVRFVATGSAAAALKRKSQESGAGRFTDFLLPPLTFAEYLRFSGREEDLIDDNGDEYRATDIEALNAEFVNYLNYGGYPEAVFSERVREDSTRFIKSDIIDKVLLRDLPQLYGIQDIQELNRLFTTLAYNTGQEVTLDALAKSANVAKNTLRKYLEYLEAAFLIRRVHKVGRGARRFQRITAFKVYLTNPSMRGALFGYIDTDHEAMGALAETAVYSQWLHADGINRIYYARWKGGEIDLVYLDPESQKPRWTVEVKWSDRSKNHDAPTRHVVALHRSAASMLEAPLVTTKSWRGEREIRGVRVRFEPTSELAYAIGKNSLATNQVLARSGM